MGNPGTEHGSGGATLSKVGVNRQVRNPGARVAVEVLRARIEDRVTGGDDFVRRIDAQEHAITLTFEILLEHLKGNLDEVPRPGPGSIQRCQDMVIFAGSD